MDAETERRLRRELDTVLARLGRMNGALVIVEPVGKSNGLGGDIVDAAQMVESRELSQLGATRLAERAKALTAALQRLRNGQYGVCDECGGTIPAPRLRAVPAVATCVRCQQRLETRRGYFGP